MWGLSKGHGNCSGFFFFSFGGLFFCVCGCGWFFCCLFVCLSVQDFFISVMGSFEQGDEMT